jgi:PD-(D/E)XK nuclease superfamily
MSECGQVKPLRISWSQISNHEICAHRAMLVRRRVKNPAADVRNFFHGIVVDRVMRDWLYLDNPESTNMHNMVESYFDLCRNELQEEKAGVVRWRSTGDKQKLLSYCQQLVTRLQPMLVKWILPYEYSPAHKFEIPIKIPYLDNSTAVILLIGEIDILVREAPGVWQIYELKSTSDSNYYRKMLGQGIFYDLSVLANFRTPAEGVTFLQPMVDDAYRQQITITAEQRQTMMARIVAVAHDRWRGFDEPKPDAAGCSQCPVRFACKKMTHGLGVFEPRRIER